MYYIILIIDYRNPATIYNLLISIHTSDLLDQCPIYNIVILQNKAQLEISNTMKLKERKNNNTIHTHVDR